MRLIHGEVTDEILAAFYEMYNELGWGFSESVYGSVMASLLAKRGLTVAREQPLRVRFRGEDHGEFRADLVVARCVLIELKSCKQIIPAHEAQLLNYLRVGAGGRLATELRPEARDSAACLEQQASKAGDLLIGWIVQLPCRG